MAEIPAEAEAVLEFWFGDCAVTGIGRKQLWFQGGVAFDEECGRFRSLQAAALRGELDGWAATPRGLLALVILLDQLSRNLFRGTAAAFAGDPQALALARRAVALAWDRELHPLERSFLYLPFEHSEDAGDQEESVRQYTSLRDEHGGRFDSEESLQFAVDHREIIARFGRLPHRNRVLGRENTDAEEAYLKDASHFGQ